MSSPVSWRAVGECNAIKSSGLGRSDLTFLTEETVLDTSHKPVSGQTDTVDNSVAISAFIATVVGCARGVEDLSIRLLPEKVIFALGTTNPYTFLGYQSL